MKIDKTQFLLLTTALSATTVAGLVAVAVGCSTTPAEPPSELGLPRRADAGEEVVKDPDVKDPDVSPSDAGPTTPTTTCLGDKGAAPACDKGPSGVVCASACGEAVTNYKVDIAKNVNDCLALGSPTTETACSAAAPKCIAAALTLACDDGAARTFCAVLVADCTEAKERGDAGAGAIPNQQECDRIVRAMTDKGRTNLTNCATEGTGSCRLNRAAGCLARFGGS